MTDSTDGQNENISNWKNNCFEFQFYWPLLERNQAMKKSNIFMFE